MMFSYFRKQIFLFSFDQKPERNYFLMFAITPKKKAVYINKWGLFDIIT